MTIGGFSGGPQDRTWVQVDGELEKSRAERGAPASTTAGHRRRHAIPPVPGRPCRALDRSGSIRCRSCCCTTTTTMATGSASTARSTTSAGSCADIPVDRRCCAGYAGRGRNAGVPPGAFDQHRRRCCAAPLPDRPAAHARALARRRQRPGALSTPGRPALRGGGDAERAASGLQPAPRRGAVPRGRGTQVALPAGAEGGHLRAIHHELPPADQRCGSRPIVPDDRSGAARCCAGRLAAAAYRPDLGRSGRRRRRSSAGRPARPAARVGIRR